MTEIWHCTDCPAEVDFDARREHMKTEHGVAFFMAWTCPGCHDRVKTSDEETFKRVTAAHARAHRACPDCTETEPCERAKALEGANSEQATPIPPSAGGCLGCGACPDCKRLKLIDRAEGVFERYVEGFARAAED